MLAGTVGLVLGLGIGAVGGGIVVGLVAAATGTFEDPELATTYGPGGDLEVVELAEGDCAEDVPELLDAYRAGDAVPCESTHRVEVYVADPAPDAATDDPPSSDDLAWVGDDLCYAQFEPFTGVAWEDTPLDYRTLVPTPTAWAEDRRTIYCLLTSGPRRGSSGRG